MNAGRRACRHIAVVSVALAALLVTPSGVSAERAAGDYRQQVAVKAAFLYNFAKFTEWPGMAAGARISACVVGDDEIMTAFVEMASGRDINGHAFDFSNRAAAVNLAHCQLLFVAAAGGDGAAPGFAGLKTLPVLTVSDAPGFAKAGGMIELYVEDGRMRFAINVDAVTRAGLRVSSRLLELAKIVRDQP